MRTPFVALLFVLSLALAAAPAVAQAPTYQVEDIGSLAGNTTLGLALNNSGEVAGESGTRSPFGPPYHAILYADGAMLDLHPGSQYDSSFAYGINLDGDVVGYLARWNIPTPFLHSRTDGFSPLVPFNPLDNRGRALDINDEGQIVGWAVQPGTFGETAFLMKAGEPAVAVTPGLQSEAFAVNNLGLVVGSLRTSPWPDTEAGFAYDGNGLVNLDELLAEVLPGEWVSFRPFDVNDRGQIVGAAFGDASVTLHAAVFDFEAWSWTRLPALSDGTSRGYAINSGGDVVGMSQIDRRDRACLWRDGEVYDLNGLLAGDPEIDLYQAADINDQGQIVAWGFALPDTRTRHTYLLTPVEPGTLVEVLIDFVIELDLHKGTENSLLVKLEHASAAIDAGSITEACNVLGAFINQVEAQSGKKIPAEDAADMIGQATSIRELLGCL